MKIKKNSNHFWMCERQSTVALEVYERTCVTFNDGGLWQWLMGCRIFSGFGGRVDDGRVKIAELKGVWVWLTCLPIGDMI